MKLFRHILMVLLLVVFASSSVASTALAACNCADMQEQAMQMNEAVNDMPCHGMDEAEKATHSEADSQKVDCGGCGCGHCNITASATMPELAPQQQPVNKDGAGILAGAAVKSLFPRGIDYPPKRLS